MPEIKRSGELRRMVAALSNADEVTVGSRHAPP